MSPKTPQPPCGAIEARIWQARRQFEAGEIERDVALDELRACAAAATRSRCPAQAFRASLAVLHLCIEAGEHLAARRALEAARPWLKLVESASERSDFLFYEAELYRARGSTYDAMTVAIRHITDKPLKSTPSFFKAFQTLISSYIDEGQFQLAADYSHAFRRSHLSAEDSWRTWPFYLLEAGAYLSMAHEHLPLNKHVLALRSHGGTLPSASDSLDRALALLPHIRMDPLWSGTQPEWQIQRRQAVGERLEVAILVHRHGAPLWPRALELAATSLSAGDIRMAMLVGQSLCLSMLESGAAARAVELLTETLRRWATRSDGDFMRANALYLLSKGYEVLHMHAQALENYQLYVSAVASRARKPPALPELPEGFLSTGFARPSQPSPIEAHGAPAYLRDALALIDAHLSSSDLTVSDLAVRAGVTNRTLLAAFKHHLGISPNRYILERRLERANELIGKTTGAQQVAEVAAQCGFSHKGRFATAYKARFGKHPSERMREVSGAA